MLAAIKYRYILVLCMLLFILPVSSGVLADEPNNVELENEYIKIIVNTDELNTGRLSVMTTGGDPDRSDDENKHLIYGGHEPWTSYTTVRVGNRNYIYGNPTNRRAGRDGQYGELLKKPTIEDDAIVSAWKTGPIEVKQILGFARSTTTGLMDTARLEYRVHNTDDVTHLVGIRMMLDTMLGENDGAPFRIDDQAVLSDKVFYSHEMPEFWQAFDSLSDPQVMAQGTLTGGEVTVPDRIYFSNWGSLADDPWNFDFQPGRDFTRKGEFELDSALALFFDPKPLQPGETRSYVAHYGLGGVTIAPGDLSLGVTSPARVTADDTHRQSFPIVAYIQNTGRGEARDVTTTISLPEGLELVSGSLTQQLGNLEVGDTIQTSWQVIPTGEHSGTLTYEVRVDAINSESNRVDRSIDIVSPAKIQAEIRGPLSLSVENERLTPSPMEVTAILRNVGGIEAYRVAVTMDHPIGLALASGERKTKYPGTIGPGEEVRVNWYLDPLGVSGNLPYSLRIDSSGGQQVVNNFVIIPSVEPKVWVAKPQTYSGSESIKPGDYFSVSVWATNIRDFQRARLDLEFNPQVAKIVGKTLDISRGALFVDEQSRPGWTMPSVDNTDGLVKGIVGDRRDNPLPLAFGTLVTIHFRAEAAGDLELELANVKVDSTSGEVSRLKVENQEIRVQ